MEKISERPVLTALRELEVGESVTFPIKRNSYVKSCCTNFGLEWDKKFKTAVNREEKTVTATRTA
ncbi:MAG: hypothetical protein K2K97_09475 [Muribaculaceae bacterium]|nr:hypothetical protein [Muribaculaceae bacterium]